MGVGSSTMHFINVDCPVSVNLNHKKTLTSETGGKTTLQKFNIVFDAYPHISMMGELYTDELHIDGCVLIPETGKLKIQYRFSLILPDDGYQFDLNNYEYPTQNFQGTGHVLLKSKKHKKCYTVQICLENLEISTDGLVTATYIGYFEDSVKIDSCYGIEACSSFTLNLNRKIVA